MRSGHSQTRNSLNFTLGTRNPGSLAIDSATQAVFSRYAVYLEMAEPLKRQNDLFGNVCLCQFCRKAHLDSSSFGGVGSQHFNLARNFHHPTLDPLIIRAYDSNGAWAYIEVGGGQNALTNQAYFRPRVDESTDSNRLVLTHPEHAVHLQVFPLEGSF